jgi:SAM-dependent methyltransferase
MDYSFPRYLLSKQTVDDRALNKDVVQALRMQLREPVSTVEVGAGIGTMLRRLVDWGILCVGEYVLVDGMAENIAYAREWIPQWAAEAGLVVEGTGPGQLRICDRDRDIRIRLECADVFDFIAANERPPGDLLIAHAFLDLLPLPASLGKLLQLTKSLAWLTINFDGVSAFQPEIDPILDEQIERLYHATMDRRLTGGDSRTGRKLFTQIGSAGAEILAAGASDWIVYPHGHEYPAEEKYFLRFILGFFEEALDGCDELDASQFKDWIAQRQEQIEHGELVYIAHQMDFLVRKRS